MASSTVCGSRGCEKPAVGQSPQFDISLCSHHLDKENAKIMDQQVKLVKRLSALRDSINRDHLRGEQCSLADELEQLSDMFDALEEKVQQWREKFLSRLQESHDSVAVRLRDALEADDCVKEMGATVDTGDVKTLLKLMTSVELWLDEAFQRSQTFDRARMELRKRQLKLVPVLEEEDDLRSVGDVSVGVQYVQCVIDQHMTQVMQHCWFEDAENNDQVGETPFLTSIGQISDLENCPVHVTWCSNSDGYVGDTMGRVVKKCDSADESCAQLPQPCVFVSFLRGEDHLTVTSLDGNLRLKFYCDLDWSQWISGLHCDSSRQLMVVAQHKAVTVTDLSGSTKTVLRTSSTGRPIHRITAITGNSDKLFLLDASAKHVLAISKETWQVESVIEFKNSRLRDGFFIELALQNTRILLLDHRNGYIYKVCSHSNQAIAFFSNETQEFIGPVQIAASRKGIMFVTEDYVNRIRVMSFSCQILQTLDDPMLLEGDRFRQPSGMTIAEVGSQEILVVADKNNARLILYRVS